MLRDDRPETRGDPSPGNVGESAGLRVAVHLRDRILAEEILRLWNTTQHHRRAFIALTAPYRMWIVNAEHNLLINAIERCNVRYAKDVRRSHIRKTRIEITAHQKTVLRARCVAWAEPPVRFCTGHRDAGFDRRVVGYQV